MNFNPLFFEQSPLNGFDANKTSEYKFSGSKYLFADIIKSKFEKSSAKEEKEENSFEISFEDFNKIYEEFINLFFVDKEAIEAKIADSDNIYSGKGIETQMEFENALKSANRIKIIYAENGIVKSFEANVIKNDMFSYSDINAGDKADEATLVIYAKDADIARKAESIFLKAKPNITQPPSMNMIANKNQNQASDYVAKNFDGFDAAIDINNDEGGERLYPMNNNESIDKSNNSFINNNSNFIIGKKISEQKVINANENANYNSSSSDSNSSEYKMIDDVARNKTENSITTGNEKKINSRVKDGGISYDAKLNGQQANEIDKNQNIKIDSKLSGENNLQYELKDNYSDLSSESKQSNRALHNENLSDKANDAKSSSVLKIDKDSKTNNKINNKDLLYVENSPIKNNSYKINSSDLPKGSIEKKIPFQNILSEISKGILSLEGKRITFNIEPENLGKIRIIINQFNEALSVKIEAENPEVRTYIENNIQTIQQQLLQNGAGNAFITVSLMSQDQKTKQSFSNSKRKQNDENLEEKRIIETDKDNKVQKNLGYNTYEYLA